MLDLLNTTGSLRLSFSPAFLPLADLSGFSSLLLVPSHLAPWLSLRFFLFPNVISSAVKKIKKKKGIQHLNISNWDGWWLGDLRAPAFFALDRIHDL